MESRLAMFEEEFQQISDLMGALHRDCVADGVLLIDRNGQYIAAHGDLDNLDTVALTSLTAAEIATSNGLSQLLGPTFRCLCEHSDHTNLYIRAVDGRASLLILFGPRSSHHLVSVKANSASNALAEVFRSMLEKAEAAQGWPNPDPDDGESNSGVPTAQCLN